MGQNPQYDIIHVGVGLHGWRTGIKCLTCGLTSWNPNDVENRYCGHCHRFHDEQSQQNVGLAVRKELD